MKLLNRIREALGPVKETRQVICDESGFTVVEHGKTLARVSWLEVLELFAYKADRFTTDDICLGFRVHEDGTFWMVSEDFVGYKELLAELERRFSGIRTDWFAEVAFPAFVRPESDDTVGTDMERESHMTWANQALQRTRREHRGGNRGVPCAGSLSLGR